MRVRPPRAQSCKRSDADPTHGRQADRTLESANGRGGSRPVAAVEVPGRKAPPSQEELEHGDVPSAVAKADRPSAERRAAMTAKCAASARSGDPVGGQRRSPLQLADGRDSYRAGDAVDGAGVDPVCSQRDLKRSDVGASGRPGLRRDGTQDRSEGSGHRGSLSRR